MEDKVRNRNLNAVVKVINFADFSRGSLKQKKQNEKKSY